MLGRRIRHARHGTADGRRAGDVDDAAVLAGPHQGQDAAHHLDGRRQVDGHHPLPDIIRHPVGAAEVVHDAGYVDEHVDAGSVVFFWSRN